MAAADQVLALEGAVGEALQRGRIAIAFSKVAFTASYTPLAVTYVPRDLEPTAVLAAADASSTTGSTGTDRDPALELRDAGSSAPPTWFGLNAPPQLHTAHAAFVAALQAAVALAAARARLAAAVVA